MSIRRFALGCALLLALLAPRLGAQVRDTTARGDTVIDYSGLPRDVARDVRDVADAPGTLRVRGDYSIDTGRAVNTDVLVRDGTLTVRGTVAGRIVALDADVVFAPGASVGGDVLVVRGTASGQADADIGGSVRVYTGGLRALADVVRGGAAEDWRWLRRWRDRKRRSGGELTLTTGRTYNRAEGLPIYVGPTLRQRAGRALTTVRAFGVVRTAQGLSLTSTGAGHLVTAEVRLGGPRGIALGGSTFDVVDAVEGWQLPPDESGLAALVAHRDFRDYFNRHGADARLTFFAGPDADVTLSYGDQRWASVPTADPYTLFRNSQSWRPNPRMDEGRFHVATATARFDTRNSVANPWAGWYLVADYERGTGRIDSLAPTSEIAVPRATGGGTTYGRAFLDVRRYNRLAPDAQLNLRLVLGGWLHGDRLPLQRRVSVGGPGTMPGFDFRRATGRTDVQQCSGGGALTPAGVPAECDRIALAQVEYRGNLGLNIDPFGAFSSGPVAALWRGVSGGRSMGDMARIGAATTRSTTSDEPVRGRITSEWVVFSDAGRGWLVGPRDDGRRYPGSAFPALRTFRSDVGIGLLFGAGGGNSQLGVYVAKAVSDADEPANVVVRLRRRF